MAAPSRRHSHLRVMVVVKGLFNETSIFSHWSRLEVIITIIIIPNERSWSCCLRNESDRRFRQTQDFICGFWRGLELEDSELRGGRKEGFLLVVNRRD